MGRAALETCTESPDIAYSSRFIRKRVGVRTSRRSQAGQWLSRQTSSQVLFSYSASFLKARECRALTFAQVFRPLLLRCSPCTGKIRKEVPSVVSSTWDPRSSFRKSRIGRSMITPPAVPVFHCFFLKWRATLQARDGAVITVVLAQIQQFARVCIVCGAA